MPEEKTPDNDMCPVCVKPFNQKDLVIKTWDWIKGGKPHGPEWIHVRCALYLSKQEETERR